MTVHTFEIEEEDRQAIVLALAKLSITRPGWRDACLRRIAEDVFRAGDMFDEFESQGADPLHAGVAHASPSQRPSLLNPKP